MLTNAVLLSCQGYHGDTSSMFACGTISEEAQKLCDATKEALHAAIAVCKPGEQTKKIGAACATVADKHKWVCYSAICRV